MQPCLIKPNFVFHSLTDAGYPTVSLETRNLYICGMPYFPGFLGLVLLPVCSKEQDFIKSDFLFFLGDLCFGNVISSKI